MSQRTEPVFHACDHNRIHFNLYPRRRLQQGISLLILAAFFIIWTEKIQTTESVYYLYLDARSAGQNSSHPWNYHNNSLHSECKYLRLVTFTNYGISVTNERICTLQQVFLKRCKGMRAGKNEITILLYHEQPLLALCRCSEDHEYRPCFNWLHWLFGTVAYCLASKSSGWEIVCQLNIRRVYPE